jgi:hypothetical protein
MTRISRRTILGAGAIAIPLSPALAQEAVRLRGDIVSLDGDVLTVAARDGARSEVRLTEPLTVAALRRVELSEIGVGRALGVVAEPGADGTLRAIAITVLPPGMRITERQDPWDLAPNTSMNNGAVEAVMESSSGRDVTLRILGRQVPVRITSETALVTPIPAARTDLVAGVRVFINASRGADGRLTATRVTVGKDGVLPPI